MRNRFLGPLVYIPTARAVKFALASGERVNAPVRVRKAELEIGVSQPPPVAQARRAVWPLASFVAVVLLPLAAAAAYLWQVAVPQYESTVGFSVRHEEAPAPVDLFGGFSGLSASGSSDADVLYEFLQSQELVAALEDELALKSAWSTPASRDPVFALKPGGTIEDLVRYWVRMARVSYDSGTGILTLRVRAFEANTAQAIAAAAYRRSSDLINTLSAVARDDALREAETTLRAAEARVRASRRDLTAFRAETQIVDPGADVSGQMGLLTRLQEELANELIRLDLLRSQTRENDPRIAAASERIKVIEARIQGERQKLGSVGGEEDYATVMDEFERLRIDVEFAEESLLGARTAYDQAVAEARRKTRYLAAHIQPTLAERATAPDPVVILGLGGLMLALIWGVGALSFASLRDRA